MSVLQFTALLGSLAASVSAHGYVQGIVAGGTWYSGYNPAFQYKNPPPTVAGWSDPEDLSNGYIAPSAYGDADIVCHLDATPGGTSAKVAAGDVVELQWTVWPDSHHGPVLDYLAKVDGEFSDVDKTALKFFKIDEGGLVDDSTLPGKWASDELIANNNSWVVKIPTSIAPGNYVLRHEIIALHSAGDTNGAQNYPQCINLEITSDGTDVPDGEPATSFYKEDDPGIKINIYTSLSTYTIPGPTLWSGAMSAISQTTVAISSVAPLSTGSATSYVEASTTTSASSSAYASMYSSSSSSVTSSSYAASPSATSAEAYTSVVTTTEQAYATATAYNTVFATFSTSEASSSTFYSDVATSTSAASPASTSSAAASDKPEKDLPEGWTLGDLQQWVSYLLKKGWSASRKHARDFAA